MHSMLAKILDGYMHQYPKALESQYARVFNSIMSTWGTAECDKMFEDLILDNRGSRQGFPADVMADLLFLSRLHDKLQTVALTKKAEDVWGNVEYQARLEKERNINFSPRGFFSATENGDQKAMALFLAAGVDVNIRNQFDWTPLMVATFMGSEASATTLIDAGANVSVRDKRGYSPLHWAAQRGFARVAELLIQKGAYADVRSVKGITPLLQAAALGRSGVVQVLLAYGAGVNEADLEGWTPLHKAVANKHLDIVRILRAAGADPDVAHHATGVTPTSIAMASKEPAISAALRN